VTLHVGTQSNGQGHETVYAQFLSDRTGIPVEAIRVVQGDSDLIATGGGTGGSRSVTVQGVATDAAVTEMIAAFTPFLAGEMGVAPRRWLRGRRLPRRGLQPHADADRGGELARARGRDDLSAPSRRRRCRPLLSQRRACGRGRDRPRDRRRSGLTATR
jgi:aerobic carbon-monoxide dehydrogenase large subunit